MTKSNPRPAGGSSKPAPKKQPSAKPGKLPKTRPAADVVDEASDESFPASDPPAWTETTASKDRAGH